MPLLKSKSKKAFGKNVETEMHAGKPQKQALAIAYSMKRKSKKASGGMVKSGDPEMDYSKGGSVDERNLPQEGVHTDIQKGKSLAGNMARDESKRYPELAKNLHRMKLDELQKMKGPHGNYAEGGEVEEDGKRFYVHPI